jgi:hypothetical protein
LETGILRLTLRDPCIAQQHSASCCRNLLPLLSIMQQVCACGKPFFSGVASIGA